MNERELKRQVNTHAGEMLGQAIQQARAAEGLTVEALAAQLGVPAATMIAAERGDLPTPDITRALYAALPTLIDQLLMLARERQRPN
jgi:transcriptional regulator with XRE-family HTH domain